MELLWLGAAAVLFVLLHAAVAAYLYRTTASNQPESVSEYVPPRDADGRPPVSGDEPPSGAADRRIPCQTCGTPNDPSYRFCRRCVANLESRVSSAASADGREQLGS